VIDERADERLGTLVRHNRDLDPARILQPRREEMDVLALVIEEAHLDLPEIVLRKFTRQAFKPDERPDRLRPQGANQVVERGLSARVAVELDTPENFYGEEIRFAHQDFGDHGPKGFGRRGTPNGTPLPFLVVVAVRDVRLTLDPAYASNADADESRYVRLFVSRLPEYVNRVSMSIILPPAV
jgi:hypothetical protein